MIDILEQNNQIENVDLNSSVVQDEQTENEDTTKSIVEDEQIINEEESIQINSSETQKTTPEETVSENYVSDLQQIINNQERIISQNEVLLQSTIRIGYALDDISNNQIVSVNGIMEKNINDYTTQEGLLLVIVVLAVSVIIVSAIKRGIFKWK